MSLRHLIQSKFTLFIAGAVAGQVATWAAETPPVAEAPLVEILASDPTALVGASSGAFTLIRSGSVNAELVVSLDITGTASNGVDYVQLNTVTNIPAGYMAADIIIEPIINLQQRGNKTVVLTLRTNETYRLAKHKRVTLTLVDDTFNNQAPVVSLISPANGSVFTLPANITLEAEATDPDDPIQKVSFYANDRYLGQATSSPFTLVWSNAPVGKYALFARAVDGLGKSTLSAPVQIRVTNAPPTITLVSPKSGSVFSPPANVTIEAEAADTDDAIAKVQVYGDNKLLKTLTNSPYSLVWSNVAPGKHAVLVRAIDAFGLSASAVATFTVSNAAPVVSLTSPKSGANFPAYSNITLAAEASDADNAIERVSFWANNRFLGSVTNSPYTLVWKNVRRGYYSLKATATDQFGARTISSSVFISVSK